MASDLYISNELELPVTSDDLSGWTLSDKPFPLPKPGVSGDLSTWQLPTELKPGWADMPPGRAANYDANMALLFWSLATLFFSLFIVMRAIRFVKERR